MCVLFFNDDTKQLNKPQRLLLIDDIRTTGATLAECVRVLKEAGAADVLCLTLAAAERDK